MTLHKLADQFLLLTAKEYAIPSHTEEFKFLKKLDAGPNHSLPTAHMSPEDHIIAKRLAQKGWIELVREDHGVTKEDHYSPRVHSPTTKKVPERYVMLAMGNYALGTFDWDTQREEENALRMARREFKGDSFNAFFRNTHLGYFYWDQQARTHRPVHSPPADQKFIRVDLETYL